MDDMTNEVLIKKVAEGDEEAFNVLYEKYYRMIYFVALKVMHNDADAQDVVQETFIQIRKSISNVKNADYLPLWINRITVNKCNTLYRKRKEVLFEENDKDPLYQYEVTDIEYLPSEHLHFTNDKEIINHFIDQLPPAQRLVIILMYYQQFSIEEIADICNIPSGTVKSRLKVARDTLRKKIELYEKKEQVKLDFNEAAASALICAALLQEASKITVKKPLVKQCSIKYNDRKAMLAACASLVFLVAGGLAIHEYQMNHHWGEQREENKVITPQEAYYTITMWANTPSLVEQKIQDISAYKKYYRILKDERGVYWKLFLKKGIQKYFE